MPRKLKQRKLVRHTRRSFMGEVLESRLLLAADAWTTIHPSLVGEGADRPTAEMAGGLSADGQWIVFESTAENLVAEDNNQQSDIFAFHRGTGEMRLVSRDKDGLGSGNGPSTRPTLSANGRFIAFQSTASNLVAAGNTIQDVYLHDLVTGETQLMSVNRVGQGGGNAHSEDPQLSADGRWLAFRSFATNLIAGLDDYANPPFFGRANLFVRDLELGRTVITTLDKTSQFATGAVLDEFAISATGRFVTFRSYSSELVEGDTNNLDDVFLHDVLRGTTEAITVDSTQANLANGHSFISSQSVSRDGRFVAFQSNASNLTEEGGLGRYNVYLRDRSLQTTTLLSRNQQVGGVGNDESGLPFLTPDGQHVVFQSASNNLLPGDQQGWDIFHYESASGQLSLVSARPDGQFTDSGNSFAPSISADGRTVTYFSDSPDLDPRDTQSHFDIFVRNLDDPSSTRISTGPNELSTNGDSFAPLISAQGGIVVYPSWATNLLQSTTTAGNLFVRDLALESTQLVTARDSRLPQLRTSESGGAVLDVTADGRHALFTSWAWHCGGGFLCSNPGFSDVAPEVATLYGWNNLYLRDQWTGETRTLTAYDDQGRLRTHQGNAYNASLSGDGQQAVFVHGGHGSAPLDPNVTDRNTNQADVFHYDPLTNSIRMLSVTPDGTASGDARSGDHVAFSTNGRYVAFTSLATDLTADPDTNGQNDLFLRDLTTGITTLISRNPSGESANGATILPRFDDAVSTLVFVSQASDLISQVEDSNQTWDVFTYDLQTQEIALISVNQQATASGNGRSGEGNLAPQISANGRFIVYGSQASDLTANDDNGSQSDVFRYDRVTGSTELVSVDLNGASTTNASSFNASVSADGQRVAFQSYSPQLTSLSDTNHDLDVFVRDLVQQQTLLVSHDWERQQAANRASYQPTLSADGQHVAYSSRATNLVQDFEDGNSAAQADLFVYHLAEQRTSLVTGNRSGLKSGAVGHEGLGIHFAESEGALYYASLAEDLAANDRNADIDSFRYQIGGEGVITGSVYLDQNRNGLRDTADPSLAWRTVFLDLDQDHTHEPGEPYATTDSQGRFRFADLLPGPYRVVLVHADEFLSEPSLRDYYELEITQANPLWAVDFGVDQPRPDLKPQLGSLPDTAEIGASLMVPWVLRNDGDVATQTRWTDRLFLSRDGVLSSDDPLIGTFQRGPTLATGDAIPFEESIRIPAILPGSYFLILVTDAAHDVNERSESNNRSVSSHAIELTAATLELDQPLTIELLPGQQSLRRLQLDDPGSLVISMTGQDGASNELLIRQGTWPDGSDVDGTTRPFAASDQVILSAATSGSYYLKLTNLHSQGSQAIELVARQPGFAIQQVFPTQVANRRVTLTVWATEADVTAAWSLQRDEMSIPAEQVQEIAASQYHVTFDLSQAPLGEYQLRMERDDDTASYSELIQVGAATGGFRGELIGPPVARIDRPSTFYLVYENTANYDIAAPLVWITSPNATPLGYRHQSIGLTQQLAFFAADLDHRQTTLPANSSFRIPISFQVTSPQFEFGVTWTTREDSRPIDWDWVESQIDPDLRALSNWPEVFAQLRQQIGATWGDYVDMLGRNADLVLPVQATVGEPSPLLDLEARIAAARHTTSARGKVQLPASNYQRPRHLQVTHSVTGEERRIPLLADGTFVISEIPGGRYHLQLDDYSLEPASFELPDQTQLDNLLITASRNAEVAVQLVSGSSLSVTDAEVWLSTNDDVFPARYHAGAARWILESIPPGSYNLRIAAEGFLTESRSLLVGQDDIHLSEPLTPASQIHFAAQLEPPPVSATILQVAVTSAMDDTLIAHSVETASGSATSLTIDGLPAGEYDVRVAAAGYTQHVYSNVVIGSGDQIQLPPTLLIPESTIAGQITTTHPDWTLETFHVGVYQSERLIQSRPIDDQGFFELIGLSAGTYQITTYPRIATASVATVELASNESLSDVNVSVDPGGHIRGRVIDRRTGKVFPGAPVQLVDEQGELWSAFSNDTGAFAFTELPLGQYTLSLPIIGPESSKQVSITSLTDVLTTDLFVHSTSSVSGTITDSDGQAVHNAAIVLQRDGRNVGLAYSNEAGYYALLLMQEGSYQINTSKLGLSFPQELMFTVAAEEDRIQDIASGSHSVRLEIVEPTAGFQDAQLTLWLLEQDREILVANVPDLDATPREFAHLTAGQYVVRIRNGDGQGLEREFSVPNTLDPLELAPQHILSGTVVDLEGVPISTATLATATDSTRISSSTQVNEQGIFELTHLNEELQDLVISAPGFQTQVFENVSVDNSALRFTLEPATATLQGRVVDPQGAPLAGVQLMVVDSQDRTLAMSATDAAGEFSIVEAVGDSLTLHIEPLSYEATAINSINLAANQTLDLGNTVVEATTLGDPNWWDRVIEALQVHFRPWNQIRQEVNEFTKHPAHVESLPPTPPPGCEKDCQDLYDALREAKGKQDEFLERTQDAQKRFQSTIGRADQSLANEALTSVTTFFGATKALKWLAPKLVQAVGNLGKMERIAPATRLRIESFVSGFEQRGAEFLDHVIDAVDAFQSFVSWSDSTPKSSLQLWTSAENNSLKATTTGIQLFEYASASADERWFTGVNKAIFTGIGDALSVLANLDALTYTETRAILREAITDYDLFVYHKRLYERFVVEANSALLAYLNCLRRPDHPENCEPQPNSPAFPPYSSYLTGSGVGAHDPNDIMGPAGVGDAHWIVPGSLMPYRVRFENDPNLATAPAQVVEITLPLDDGLDLASLELGEVAFGDHVFTVPPGRTRFASRVAYQNEDETPLWVDLAIELDFAARRLNWRLESIDPHTNLPPEDPFHGLLPPNAEDGRGEGHVTFFVRSLTHLEVGRRLAAQASIVFDTNAPILTNTYVNAVDDQPPTSRVSELPEFSPQQFEVSWNGNDASGVGIASYDVYVSQNGEPYTLWQSQVTETGASFTGSPGTTYAFFSVARDHLGFVESLPTAADSATTIAGSPWQNPSKPLDVNDDTLVTAQDVIILINWLNAHPGDSSLPPTSEQPPPYYDVSGDNQLTALDPLHVINFINRNGTGEGESTSRQAGTSRLIDSNPRSAARASREMPLGTDSIQSPFADDLEQFGLFELACEDALIDLLARVRRVP